MSVEVHVFSRAEKNIADAFGYYENESTGLGEVFIRFLEIVITNVAEYPEMYPKVYGEIRRASMRHFPYAVFYLYDQGEATILNVLNTRQDIESLLEED